mmetsp:Transcript_17959/g.43139  ORF Transcript_17959/g.43139 Transcript_17959/m.43139 type:complete len:80 (-) Transcript_17959:472-711(-)
MQMARAQSIWTNSRPPEDLRRRCTRYASTAWFSDRFVLGPDFEVHFLVLLFLWLFSVGPLFCTEELVLSASPLGVLRGE